MIVILWLWRRKSHAWHRTLLDPVFLLWGIAFAVSTSANMDMQARIASGLWFATTYMIVWYVLQDSLGNGLIRRESLADLLLIVGVLVLISAIGEASTDPPGGRISGAMQNPNNLGAFLLLIILLILERLFRVKGAARVLFGVYLVVSLVVMIATKSRGAIFGLVIALLVVGLMRVRTVWLRLSLLVFCFLIGVVLFIARGDNGRFVIYSEVAAIVAEHPITGTGLFTFRIEGLSWLEAGGTKLYAHNLVLHVASELGVFGLVALARFGWVLLRKIPPRDDSLSVWAYSGLLGAGVHQMVDFPLMMPSLALTALIVLSLALPPSDEVTDINFAPLVAAGAGVLIIIGVLASPLSVG